MIRVHIVHDNHLLRDTLAIALDREPGIETVEMSPEGATGLEAVSDGHADVLVLWVPWRTQPFDEIARHRRAAPGMKIVGLYTHTSVRNEMIAAGADTAVDEADGLDSLIEAIRRVAPVPADEDWVPDETLPIPE